MITINRHPLWIVMLAIPIFKRKKYYEEFFEKDTTAQRFFSFFASNFYMSSNIRRVTLLNWKLDQ